MNKKYWKEQYEQAYLRLQTESENDKAQTAEETNEYPMEASALWQEFFTRQNRRDAEMSRFRQRPLRVAAIRAGLVISADYEASVRDYPGPQPLSEHGEARLRQELRTHKLNRAKDWVAILMPMLSLLLSSVIAILGLLVALRKK